MRYHDTASRQTVRAGRRLTGRQRGRSPIGIAKTATMVPKRGGRQPPSGRIAKRQPASASIEEEPIADPVPPPLQYSDRFIASVLTSVKTIAMVGATANIARPAYIVMKYLKSRGYHVIPVNPGHAGKEILGETAYARLADIPEPVDMVDIFRRSDAAAGVVDEALALDPLPRVIWMQLGIRNDEAAARAQAAGITVVMNRCPKIEFGRLTGENNWAGINTGRIGNRMQRTGAGFQRLELPTDD